MKLLAPVLNHQVIDLAVDCLRSLASGTGRVEEMRVAVL
jgi:hypothetical protein